MYGNVSAGEETAGRIAVAEMNREEIVRAGVAVVGYVERETDLRPSDFSGPSDVRLVSVEAKRGNLRRME